MPSHAVGTESQDVAVDRSQQVRVEADTAPFAQQQPQAAPKEYSLDQQEAPSPRSVGDPPIREEDVHVRIFQEMSRDRPMVMSPTSQSQNTNRREVIEYHEGVNSMTILGEALGQQRPNRLVRIIVLDDGSKLDPQKSFPGLDEADLEYLQKKGALKFPPRHTW